MMTKMQAIVFSNYLLIEKFLDDCSDDVKTYSCGRIQTEEDEEVPHHDIGTILLMLLLPASFVQDCTVMRCILLMINVNSVKQKSIA